jgi:GH25 family lysozyme M1 (1,4-beta-N-acetylmuramidase)
VKKLVSFALLFVLLLGLPVSARADLMSRDGVLCYFDENGREAREIGLDVSFYNNQIDWVALKNQGFSFVMVRLGGRGWGTGSMYGDRQTQAYLRGAQEAGLKVGAYFYSAAINPTEAVEEASQALHTLNGFQLDLPLYIDMELTGSYPNGRSDSLTPGERADIVEAFCRTVEAAGYDSGLYASEAYLRYNIDKDAVDWLPLWMASYTVDNKLPAYIDSYDVWQQSDSCRAGGVDGPFDFNIVF